MTTEELIQKQASEIFTVKNLGAIQYVLNTIKPKHAIRCKGSEYETVVEMARLDGIDDLINKVVEYVQKTDKTLQGGR
jgi:hypothetical protein